MSASRKSVVIPTNIGLSDVEIKIVDPDQFDVNLLRNWSDGDSKYLVYYQKFNKDEEEPLGAFLALSNDRGSTFDFEIPINNVFKFDPDKLQIEAGFVANRVLLAGLSGGNLYFSVSQDGLSGWSGVAQVNDSLNSVSYFSGIAAFDQSRFTLVWKDVREGAPKLFASTTGDGGNTWSFDIPVDPDLEGDSQESASLGVGDNERIILAWSDWRSKNTLVDIRYATSDDHGKTWSKSKVVNDDKLEVWQLRPKVLVHDSTVVIAFSDFREKGADDDGDWNIYFARSTDNGESWEKNRRLNSSAHGRQGALDCSSSAAGGFYCTFSSTENSVFGQIMISASSDLGKTWSQETPLTSVDGLKVTSLHASRALSNGRVGLNVSSFDYSDRRSKHVFAEAGKPAAVSKVIPEKQIMNPIEFSKGKILFSDDFGGSLADQWEGASGIWKIENGVLKGLLGYGSAVDKSVLFRTFARIEEPEKYVISGKFMLDPLYHDSASIYLKVSGSKYLVVTNQFRRGAWIAYESDSTRPAPNILETVLFSEQPLAGKRFSFKNDRWYTFEIVVTPKQIDYYLEGKLLLSANDLPTSMPGKIGLGGHNVSPTYFDDITITEFRQ